MTMKKNIILICTCALVFTISSGCGTDQPATDVQTSDIFSVEVIEQEVSKPIFKGVTIEPTTVYDSNDIKAIAHDLVRDDYGYYIDVDIENNSSNDIVWNIFYWTVNGINIPCYTCYSVAAGTSEETGYSISLSDLEECGIETINTVQLQMHYEIDNHTIEYISSDEIVTSAGADYNLPIPIDIYPKVYDENGIKIYLTGITDGEFYDPNDNDSEYYTQVNMWVYNDTNSSMYVYLPNSSHDGIADESYFNSFFIYPNSYSKIYAQSYDDLRNASTISFDFSGSDLNSDDEIIHANVTFDVN